MRSLIQNIDVLLYGVIVTLELVALSIIFSLIIGAVIALLRMTNIKILRIPAMVFIEVFRNIPSLIQLLWIYYVLPVLFGLSLPPYVSAVMAFALNGGAYTAEIFRGGIQSIPKNQWDAANAIGLDYIMTLKKIIIPQALRRMIPPLMNEFIRLTKSTSLVSIIAVPDILYRVSELSSETFLPLEFYTAGGILYYIIITPVAHLALRMEKRTAVT